MTKKQTDFPRALKSFVGHLEGTHKSLNTIKNYRLDLVSFERFLESRSGDQGLSLESLNLDDIEQFHEYLRSEGQRANTRRRKLMTVQRFLRYLFQRKKVEGEAAGRVPTPAKIERLPRTLDWESFIIAISSLPEGDPQELRDRLLIRVLAETRCLVSEAVELRWEDLLESEAKVRFGGKNSREVPVSLQVARDAEALRGKRAYESPWVFLGYNKFGPLAGRITPRGAELLVKSMGPALGVKLLTPRLIRHSGAIEWLKQGHSWSETRTWLGLRSDSAYRTYGVMLKSKS